MERKICCFTGHRVLPADQVENIYELFPSILEKLYSQGVREFRAGGALGFDTLAAREVIKYRISHPDVSLVLALPCVNQDERWSARQRDAYSYVLSSANEVVYISEEFTDTCMKDRNRYLVEEADVLIAYASRSASGAGQTVRMAKKRGVQVYNLYFALPKGDR